jgi:hypothetical protein
MTGDERFLLDSFTDDVVSNSRYVDLNTDIIPRGHLTLTSYEIRADEFANPNVWLKMVVENNNEIRNMLTKLRAIPITVKYDLVLHLSSEIDTFKCSQAILDTLWLYRFMYFEYNFLNIDAVMQIPDSSSIEINREKNLTSDNTIKLTVSFDVQTYYPAYRKPKLPDLLPYTIQTGYPSKNVNIKIELVQSVNNQVAYSEFHNSTSSSDGTVVLQIGAGSALVGSYLNVNFNTAGTKTLSSLFAAPANQIIYVQTSGIASGINGGLFRLSSLRTAEVPAPLPLLGAALGFRVSRRIRKRIGLAARQA